ncbi:MAG: hypothetical protein HY084_12560 [Gemmatimonadetes bacterium]|nr:hypothetical protein [Gemmatimonadota bacterium]
MAVRSLTRAGVLLAALALAAPSRTGAQGTASERVQYVKVVGADYQFHAPASVEEGISVFHLVNAGSDVHQMTVIELGTGHTVKDFFDAMHAKGMPPAWAVTVGATPIIQKGTEALLALRLPPGKYVLACLIPASDGRSHTEKGMYQAFNVTPLAKAAAKPSAPAKAAPATPAKKP